MILRQNPLESEYIDSFQVDYSRKPLDYTRDAWGPLQQDELKLISMFWACMQRNVVMAPSTNRGTPAFFRTAAGNRA